MPAYNYQQTFVPYIEDETKGHTVRALRKGKSRQARPGETLYQYFGMRTKWCRKIGEAICSKVVRILITEVGICLDDGENGALMPEQRDRFAWSDGFRPPGPTIDNPVGAWEVMLSWFGISHELPFEGVVIYWKDFKATQK